MKSAGHRIAVTFLSNVLSPTASLATAPLLARGLGVDGRGEVAAAIAPLILAATIATLGMPSVATYFVARTPRVARTVARRAGAVCLLSGLLAMGLVAWAAPWLSRGDENLLALILLSATLTIPTIVVVLLQGVASGLQQWNRVLAERSISAVGRVIIICTLFITDNLTPITALLTLTIVPLVGGLAYLRMWPKGHDSVKPPSVPSMLHLGGRMWFGTLSGVLLSRLDQALMAPLSSTSQLGYYAVAVSMSELALVANNSIREVMFPDLASRFDADRLVIASRVSTLIATVIGASVAIGTVFLIPWAFGGEFSPAVPVALVLILAVLAGNPGSMAGVGLNALGRPGRRSISLAIACVVNIVAIVALVPSFGALGAAIATLIGNVVSSNLNIVFLWRLHGISPWEFYRVRVHDARILLRGLAALLQAR